MTSKTAILLAAAMCAAGFSTLSATADGPRTWVVGVDADSIQATVDLASPGDTVLIPDRVYQEEVFVTTPDLTITGASRLGTILDGGTELANGFTVTANGVTIKTLTVRNYASNGMQFTRVDGFHMLDLYAENNYGYGLYAIHSKNGEIGYSYGTGHGDSAFYLGETIHCDCDVHHNVGWGNMLGYSGTANSYVRIWANEFYANRAGILMSVLPNEMGYDENEGFYGTQVGSEIYGNYVHDNNDHTRTVGVFSTVHPPVGEGIVIAGGWNNHVHDNVLENNALWGVGLFWLTTPPRGNVIENNVITGGNYGIWWDEWGEDNCFEGNVVDGADKYSDPDPLPDCEGLASLVGVTGCGTLLQDWAACRLSDVRVVNPLKEADLAWRSLEDADPDETLLGTVLAAVLP